MVAGGKSDRYPIGVVVVPADPYQREWEIGYGVELVFIKQLVTPQK